MTALLRLAVRIYKFQKASLYLFTIPWVDDADNMINTFQNSLDLFDELFLFILAFLVLTVPFSLIVSRLVVTIFIMLQSI
ncbi:hypothetical protein DL98DRAFT_597620 [Cadophora sp. DSE1049]|nr:hypothetical protein DL98DRAFT_597620 [Cadophora sp. DSE1049]